MKISAGTAVPLSIDLLIEKRWRTLLAGVCLIGFAIRLPGLGTHDIWYDEAASWMQSNGSLGHLLTSTANDNYPPLHNLLLYVSINLFGDSEWALRLPSLLAGSLNVLAIYWVASIVGGRRVGLCAAAFLALAKFHIWHSHEARMYTLIALAATVFAGTALRWILFEGKPAPFLAFGSGVALLYSHPYGLLTWLAIIFGVLAANWFTSSHRRAFWSWFIKAQVAAGLCFLPWGWLLKERAEEVARNFWIPVPSSSFVWRQYFELLGSKRLRIVFIVGVFLAILIAYFSRPLRSRNADMRCYRIEKALPVLMCWALLTPTAGLLISYAVKPLFIARYVIGTLPAWIIMASVGFMGNGVAFRYRICAGFLGIFFTLKPAFQETPMKSEWHSIAQFLKHEMRAEDCLVIAPIEDLHPFYYYYRAKPECLTLISRGLVPREEDYSGRKVLFVYSSRAGEEEAKPFVEFFHASNWNTSSFAFGTSHVLVASGASGKR